MLILENPTQFTPFVDKEGKLTTYGMSLLQTAFMNIMAAVNGNADLVENLVVLNGLIETVETSAAQVAIDTAAAQAAADQAALDAAAAQAAADAAAADLAVAEVYIEDIDDRITAFGVP